MLLHFEPVGEDRRFGLARARGRSRAVPMDAYRRGDMFFVHFDLPGIDPDAIELTVDGDVLAVKAERIYKEQDGDEILVNERPQGMFHREVYLSEGLDRGRLEASYRDGVLTVRLPLIPQPKPVKVPISAMSSSRPVGTSDA